MPPSPIRIAILETDTPLKKTKAKYGGYGGTFKVLLEAGAMALGRPDPVTGLETTYYHVVDKLNNYPSLDNIDAILITGSRYDAHAEIPWINRLVEFTAGVLKQDKVKLIGVCFGHQIVGRAMGAKVGRNSAWEVAVQEVDLTPRGKQLFGRDKLFINQMHQDIVMYYPDGVEPLGSSPVCQVQGMYKEGRVLTIQGHPEFNEEIMREIIQTRYDSGIFNQEAYDKYMKRASMPHDGVVVAMAFIKFLLSDRQSRL